MIRNKNESIAVNAGNVLLNAACYFTATMTKLQLPDQAAQKKVSNTSSTFHYAWQPLERTLNVMAPGGDLLDYISKTCACDSRQFFFEGGPVGGSVRSPVPMTNSPAANKQSRRRACMR